VADSRLFYSGEPVSNSIEGAPAPKTETITET